MPNENSASDSAGARHIAPRRTPTLLPVSTRRSPTCTVPRRAVTCATGRKPYHAMKIAATSTTAPVNRAKAHSVARLGAATSAPRS